MKPQLSIEAFADWCAKQPAEKEYDYHNWHECACAQYAASLGIEDWGQSGFWADANYVAINKPHTFGALAARLRAAQ